MQVVGAAGQGLALEPLERWSATPSPSVSVSFQRLGGGDIEGTVVPERPFREHHPVGEYGPLVVPTVAVTVFEPQDPVRPIDHLLDDRVVGAGRVGDVEPAFFIEVGGDRAIDQRGRRSVPSRSHRPKWNVRPFS